MWCKKEDMKRRIIIGASAAGIGALNAFIRQKIDLDVLLISAERNLPYNKCLLADYLSGIKTNEQLSIMRDEYRHHTGVRLCLGTTVSAIEIGKQCVVLEGGELVPYDQLLIATGAAPWWPSIKGLGSLGGVVSFHTKQDVDWLVHRAIKGTIRKAVVVGAGLSGLECADALNSRGVKVAVIDRAPQVLPRHLLPEASAVITACMERLGVSWHPLREVNELIGKDGVVVGVLLDDGTVIKADCVVITTGVQPLSQLAVDAGIVSNHNGIVVDQFMHTSAANVYAAGDVVVVKEAVTGALVNSSTWPDAMMQGLIAANSMMGIEQRPYPGAFPLLSTAFFGLKCAVYGPFSSMSTLVSSIKHYAQSGENGEYRAYLIENDRLVGFVLLGDTKIVGALRKGILTGASAASLPLWD